MRLRIGGIDVHTAEPETKGTEKPPALLCVHGAGGNAAMWDAQVPYFRGRRLLYRLDLPGHGRSGGAGEEDLSAYARCLRRIIQRAFAATPHVLVGHSMGGAILQVLALDPPQSTMGLALIGTGARLNVVPMVFQMLRKDPEAFYKSTERAAFAASTPQEIREPLTAALRTCPFSVIEKDLKACSRFDIHKRLKDVRLPTLIVCGREDLLTPVGYAETLRDNLPGSRLVVIPQTGHMVMAERPGEFNRALERFAAEIGAGAVPARKGATACLRGN